MSTIANIISELGTCNSNEDKFKVSLVEFLRSLEDYECELVKSVYNEEEDDFEEIETDNIEEYLRYLDEKYGLHKEYESDTYNWLAPIDCCDFLYMIYECNSKYYVRMRFHACGCFFGSDNYNSNEILLKFDSEGEMQGVFYESEKSYKFEVVELDGKEYYVFINMWSELKEVSNEDGDVICYTHEDEEEEILSDLKEKLA